MANYVGYTRTNYFHVTDADGFRNFMSTVYAAEDTIAIWDVKDADGNQMFGFGCYSSIIGLADGDDEDCEYDYDGFIDGLKKYIADRDACIIFEAGHEKLRYLVQDACIVTNKESKYIQLPDIAIEKVAEMLGNPDWDTKYQY